MASATYDYETQIFPAAPGGINLEAPPSEIGDDEAYLIQDAFPHQYNFLVQRGPVKAMTGSPSFAHRPYAVMTCSNPIGEQRVAVVCFVNSTTVEVSVVNVAITSVSSVQQFTLAVGDDPIWQSSAAPHGVMMGLANRYNGVTGLIYWGGGASVDYTNAGVTTSRNSAAVTAASGFTANVTSGMWVYSGNQLIGQVRSVDSDTTITLVKPCTKTVAAGSVKFMNIRGLYSLFPSMTGRLTTASTSAVVNGGATKFQRESISTTHESFRWRDFKYDGTVSSVQSDFQLTYTANAATDSFDEQFVLIPNATSTDPDQYWGWLPALYAGHMWYANKASNLGGFTSPYRIWFAHALNEDAVDTTDDGDWFDVKSSQGDQKPIRGMGVCHNSMLIFKEDETFALYGTTPDTFNLQRVFDDGLWSPMSIQSYREGVIWAGKRGVYYYDGASITNLLEDKMTTVWRKGLAGRDSGIEHMWSMLTDEHYFLHFRWGSPVSMTRGASVESPTLWTLSINLVTGAIAFHSNLFLRGSVQVPSASGAKKLYVIPTNTTGAICSTDDLFNTTGTDTSTCQSPGGTATAGPAWYYESKKFSAGDPETIKKWRQLNVHYYTNGQALSLDTVVGLNATGVLLGASTFADTAGSWTAARARFGKLSTHFAFRLYKSSATTVRFATFELKFRRLRPWRV